MKNLIPYGKQTIDKNDIISKIRQNKKKLTYHWPGEII